MNNLNLMSSASSSATTTINTKQTQQKENLLFEDENLSPEALNLLLQKKIIRFLALTL